MPTGCSVLSKIDSIRQDFNLAVYTICKFKKASKLTNLNAAAGVKMQIFASYVYDYFLQKSFGTSPPILALWYNYEEVNMKPATIFSLLFLTTISMSLQAQLKKNSYRVRVESLDGKNENGMLIALNDSTIHLLTSFRPQREMVFSIDGVKTISLRRRNSPGRGFAIGAGIGAGLGALIGWATYSPPDCQGNMGSVCLDGAGLGAFALGTVGGLSGGFLGLITHLGYKRFAINGDKTKYDEFRRKILNGQSQR